MELHLSNRKVRQYLSLAVSIADIFQVCQRMSVACILVSKEGVTFGYNGGGSGDPVSCIGGDPGTCGCVHAEANAVAKSTLTGDKLAFITVAPCKVCAALLVNHGVTGVYYLSDYRDDSGINLLRRCNVTVTKVDM